MLCQSRFRQHLVVGALIIGAGLLAGPSRAEPVLRWKFTAGEKTPYALKMDMTQAMGLAGNNIEIKTTQLIDMTWKVESVTTDGAAMMTQTIDRIRMEMTTQGPGAMSMKFDSAEKKKPEGLAAMLAPLFEGLVGKPVSMKMTPRGEVSDIKIPKEMLDAFKKLPGAEQMGGMFTEDGFKQMTSQAMLSLPEEAVKDGTTWTSASETKNPLLGTQKLSTTYTYQGTEKRDGQELAKIGTQVQMKFDAPANAAIKVDVKEQNNKGAILFDNAKGRISESSSTAKMKMEIAAMGQTINQDVTVESSLKLAPAEKPAEK